MSSPHPRLSGAVPPRSDLHEADREALLELVSDLAFVVDVATGVPCLEWVSSGFGRITGQSRDETDLEGWANLIHPNDLARVAGALERVDPDADFTVEFRLRSADGSFRWLSAHCRTVGHPTDPAAVRVYGAARDITRERELRERWRAVSQLTTDVAYSFRVEHAGAQTRLVPEWVAGAHEDVTGYSVEEMRTIGTWRDILHPDDLDAYDEALTSVLEGGESLHDFRIVTKDGSVRSMRVHTVAETAFPGGLAIRLHGAARDVTDEVAAAAELHSSEERYRALVEAAPDGIVLIQDGAITYGNPAAAALLGLAGTDQLLGRPAAEFLGVDALRGHRDGDSLTGHPAEVTVTRADGRLVPVEVRSTRILQAGRPAIQAVIRDATERVRTRHALEGALSAERRATERLREVDEIKDVFLQNVSHELRTPLTPIIGFASALRARGPELDAPSRDEMIRSIETNAHHMARLVNRLLDYTHLAADSTGVVPEVRELDATLDRVLTGLSPILVSHHLRREFDTTASVVADLDAVDRILGNLISNAVKYAPPGSTIVVRSQLRQEEVVVSVADEGPGIEPSLLPKLFERFAQAADQPAGRRGFGVGLTIARHYAELSGGSVWGESRPGRGSVFSFTLPLAQMSEATGTAR